jgi:large subunit ribosomal protein L13
LDRVIVDATDCIIGRLGVEVSKLTRLGKEVIIVNCEKTVLTGSKKMILDKYMEWLHRGSTESGPRHPKRPDRFVRQRIRGMFDYKSFKGKKAFARVKVFIGVPDEYKNISNDFKCKKSSDLMHNKYMKVEDLCKQLGGKW